MIQSAYWKGAAILNNEEKILDMLAQMQTDIAELKSTQAQMQTDLTRVAVTQENIVLPQIQLLADGQKEIREMLVPRSRVDDLEDEVKFLKSVIRQINEDVQKLKKAQ